VRVERGTEEAMLRAAGLPRPRGPISTAIIRALRNLPGGSIEIDEPTGDALADDDLHLALYVCYELHYRGWSGVHPAWEWDAALIGARNEMERVLQTALNAAIDVPASLTPQSTVDALRALVEADGPSVSGHMERTGTLDQLRELAVHRSAYQLKEADPHTWAIPRLPAGRAKSALLRLQFDEYGNGRPGASHAELFADTMSALGLDPSYGAYLDSIPGVTLATVNLLSMLGLHRELVGACVGHLAVFEMTSVEPMRRYAKAMRRLTGSDSGSEFYDVHVTADAEHQVVAIADLVPGLLEQDSMLSRHVLFGAAALMLLERRLAEHLLARWHAGDSSLLGVWDHAKLRRAS
jgi:hypothetical protein